MPSNSQAANNRPPFERIQEQIERLANQPSGLVDLGYALAGQVAPADEQACDACQASLPDYIEAELNGEPVRRRFPAVARHLDVCLDCGQTYIDLLEIALQTEAEPLPVPATALTFDLSFLPPLRPVEQIRPVVEALVKGLAPLWPPALADLAWAMPDFFRWLQASGPGIRLRPAREFVLGYGAELPPALQLLAATYDATYVVVHDLSVEELAGELSEDRPASALEKQARFSARDAGLGRREAQRWAGQYVALARLHADEMLALARLVNQDERPDEHG